MRGHQIDVSDSSFYKNQPRDGKTISGIFRDIVLVETILCAVTLQVSSSFS